MKGNFLLCLLTTALLVFLLGFSKYDPNCGRYKDEYYNLTDDSKSKINFKGFDTLVFISNVGDTATLFGHGKTQTNVAFPQQTTNADCPGITEYYEKIEIGFFGDSPELHNLNFKYYVKESSAKDYIELRMDNHYFFTKVLSYMNNPTNYLDTIIYKNNKIYGFNASADDNSSYCLYNLNYGVLRLKINGGKTWILN